jgi:hypothetical protein
MGFLQSLFTALAPKPERKPRPKTLPRSGLFTSTGLELSHRDVATVNRCVQSIVRVINESMRIANTTANAATKESRIWVVREKIVQLKKEQSKFPFIGDGNISQILSNLQNIESQALPVKKKTARPKGKPRKIKDKE